MVEQVEFTWLNDNKTVEFNLGSHKRILSCPSKRKKQIGKRKYYFDNGTVAVSNIRAVDLYKTTQKVDEPIAKRLWESFWTEGWR